MKRVFSFFITQPCNGVTFEHVVEITPTEVYGAENIKPVVDNISLPNLLRRIVNSSEPSGSEGPYAWKWH